MAGRTSVVNHAKHRQVTITSREEEEREAKAYALQCFACLVEEGLAHWYDGDGAMAELRLVTGEIYRLGEKTVWRIT